MGTFVIDPVARATSLEEDNRALRAKIAALGVADVDAREIDAVREDNERLRGAMRAETEDGRSLAPSPRETRRDEKYAENAEGSRRTRSESVVVTVPTHGLVGCSRTLRVRCANLSLPSDLQPGSAIASVVLTW